ncbi:MAG: T9SS type A sorting domain-containing protein, partial [Bacteroidales bacterium]|nr:T9SS type A sorting domain-containing protein [Bacteroidales bacterium]
YIDGYDWINESNETISVYPNPTTDNVNILAPGINHVAVMNAIGQVIYESNADGNMATLDMSQYQTGVYMVRVTTENGQIVKLVTKQ